MALTTFTTGSNLPASLLNTFVQVLALGGSLVGGTPPNPTGTPYGLQTWVGGFTTDGSGNGNLTFPVSFPNGVVSILALCTFAGGTRNWLIEYGANPTLAGVGATLWNVNTNLAMPTTAFLYTAWALGW